MKDVVVNILNSDAAPMAKATPKVRAISDARKPALRVNTAAAPTERPLHVDRTKKDALANTLAGVAVRMAKRLLSAHSVKVAMIADMPNMDVAPTVSAKPTVPTSLAVPPRHQRPS
jgi:hypothetical protein